MKPAPSFRSSRMSSTLAESDTVQPSVSPGASAPGEYAGRPFDLWHRRKVLPDDWSRFLRAHFRSSTHVQHVFGCDERTARRWWNANVAPRAEVVLAVIEHMPAAAAQLIGRAA